MREEPSIWAFPTILSLHTIGLAFVVGINVVVALRVLGVGPAIPSAELKRFMPAMWAGFWLNALSGVVLLIGYPTKALTNPLFYLKLLFVGLGVLIIRRMAVSLFVSGSTDSLASESVVRDPVRGLRPLAWASLVCWGGAIAAGRLLAYTHTRLLQGLY
jgi:hypothetical protein